MNKRELFGFLGALPFVGLFSWKSEAKPRVFTKKIMDDALAASFDDASFDLIYMITPQEIPFMSLIAKNGAA